jgi:hypothetical protein
MQPLVSCFDISAYRSWSSIIRSCIVVLACCVVLFEDYKLTPNGLLFGIPVVLLLGVVYAIYRHQTDDMELHRSKEDQPSMLTILILPLISAVACFLVSAVTCYLSLESDYEVALTWSLAPMLLLNVAATVSTITLAPSMLEQTKKNTSHNLVLLALPGFTALLSQQLGLYISLSYVQILAFSTSVCCCTLIARMETESDYLSEEGWLEVPMGARDDTKYPESLLENLQDRVIEVQKRWPSAQTMFLVITTIVWVHCLTNSYLTPFPQHNTHKLRLDTSYAPASAIDIVMSIYREAPSHVTDTFSLLNSLPSIGSKAPRLILYTKDPAANLTLLQQQTNATKIIQLPNVGREGHTYLHHMISSWDDLAAQTFFLQASIHNPREFTARVRDYYTPQTGMLSLGFSGQSCECNDCGDRFGWQDHSSIVEETWKEVFNQTCGTQRLLLSYKGQFVASAARVRANEKAMYERLRDALQEPDSWAHSDEYLQDRPDSLNAPYFGYTLERLWSVIMQCSDEQIAALCPTLLSGQRRGGSKADCQCMDP